MWPLPSQRSAAVPVTCTRQLGAAPGSAVPGGAVQPWSSQLRAAEDVGRPHPAVLAFGGGYGQDRRGEHCTLEMSRDANKDSRKRAPQDGAGQAAEQLSSAGTLGREQHGLQCLPARGPRLSGEIHEGQRDRPAVTKHSLRCIAVACPPAPFCPEENLSVERS